MFQRALVVKVAQDDVILAIRTSDNRVDEFRMPLEAFRGILGNTREDGGTTHLYIPITERYTQVYVVHRPEYDVMVAQFEAQVGA